MNLKPWLTRQTQRSLNSALALAAGIALLLPFSNSLLAQENRFDGLDYRSIGPFRGGRSAAVTGVPGENNLYYMGSTGGGVWETRDGGANWKNISDGYFGGYIGKRQPCRKAELTKCINQMYNLRNNINDKDASAQNRAVSDRMITDLDNVQFAQQNQ